MKIKVIELDDFESGLLYGLIFGGAFAAFITTILLTKAGCLVH